MQKRTFLHLAAVSALSACGGGGSDTPPVPMPTPRLVGDVFASPDQVATGEIASNSGFSGNAPTSRAMQQAGKANLLNFQFLFPMYEQGAIRLAPDAEALLDRYIQQNGDLLPDGVRLYLIDEMYLAAARVADDPVQYQAQLDDLKRGIALLRRRLPRARVGISFSPYANFDRPKLMPFVQAAIAEVDWIGTTPYYLGEDHRVAALHDWSRSLHPMAKAIQPRVETWYIAQAYRDSNWDRTAFRDYMRVQLEISDAYDAIVFFGWQELALSDTDVAGRHFEPETRALYSRFLKR